MNTKTMTQVNRTKLVLALTGLIFCDFALMASAYAEGSCVKARGRSGYTISRDCVYQGRDAPEARVTNIYVGASAPAPAMDLGYGVYDSGNNICAAPAYQPAQYQAQYPMPQYAAPQSTVRQIAPGVYVQSQLRAAQYQRPQYLAPQYSPQPLAYGQVPVSMNAGPQLFQQSGQMSFQVQNSPLLLSPSALAQAVPVYLIQNANYGQYQTPTPVAQPALASAPAPAPIAAQAPVAAPAPIAAQAPVAAPAPLPQYQGMVSNEVMVGSYEDQAGNDQDEEEVEEEVTF